LLLLLLVVVVRENGTHTHTHLTQVNGERERERERERVGGELFFHSFNDEAIQTGRKKIVYVHTNTTYKEEEEEEGIRRAPIERRVTCARIKKKGREREREKRPSLISSSRRGSSSF
jgi:hypothetical protein